MSVLKGLESGYQVGNKLRDLSSCIIAKQCFCSDSGLQITKNSFIYRGNQK